MDSHFSAVGSSNLELSLKRREQSMLESLQVFSCPAKRSGAERPLKCSRRWPIHCASPRLARSPSRASPWSSMHYCTWRSRLLSPYAVSPSGICEIAGLNRAAMEVVTQADQGELVVHHQRLEIVGHSTQRFSSGSAHNPLTV